MAEVRQPWSPRRRTRLTAGLGAIQIDADAGFAITIDDLAVITDGELSDSELEAMVGGV